MKYLSFFCVLTLCSLVLIPSALQGSEGEPATTSLEESGSETLEPERNLLWAETGEMHSGTLEPQTLGAVPLELLGEVDKATLQEIAEKQRKFRLKDRRIIPPLKYETIIPLKAGEPPHPPTEINGQGPLQTKAPNDFQLFTNTNPSSVAPPGFSSIVNEPSVVKVGDQVLYTGNWYMASSSDGGQNFSFVNPFTGPFATTGGGFCCDQVTTYHPETDTLFLLQQYIDDGTRGVQRINVDQEADGTFDCFYDISPQTVGFASGNWADYPDLAVSDNYLFHSSNVFTTSTSLFSGAFAARYDIDGLANCSSVPFDTYMDTSGFFSFRFTRGATTTMYFADHISTSSLRIWRWRDADDDPVAFDRTVSTWTDSIRTCPVGGGDPCGFVDRRIQGAYLADGTLGFFWMPSQDGSFPMPYTRIAQFSEATLVRTSEPLIWSGGFAWIYPSVNVNEFGDIGGTVMAAGGTLHPSCVVWLADDVNGNRLAPLENQVVEFGSMTPAGNRTGDYTWAQPNYPNDRIYAGACFSTQTTGAGNSRFVVFGREKNGPDIFADGFESGNVSSWTTSQL